MHIFFIVLVGLDESKKAEVESLALTKGNFQKLYIISTMKFLNAALILGRKLLIL